MTLGLKINTINVHNYKKGDDMIRYIPLIAACSLTLSGCAIFKSFGEQARVQPTSIMEVAGLVCEEYGKNKSKYDGVNVKKYFASLCGDAPEDDKIKSFTYSLLTLADNVCAVELSELSGNRRGVNAIMSVLNTSLSTAATIVTGSASTYLSGTATVVGASRDHINAEVYRNAITSSVVRVINEDKDALKLEIEKKLEGKEPKITLEQVVFDANRYHQKCSFYNGLMLVNEALNNPNKLANSIMAAEHEITRLEQQINASKSTNKEGTDKVANSKVAALEEKIDQLNSYIISARIPAFSQVKQESVDGEGNGAQDQ